MHTSNYIYYHGEQECHAFLAYDDRIEEPRPMVLVAPDWSGRNQFACDKAIQLAKMGYVGFVLDVYGLNRLGRTKEEKLALMEPLMADRLMLRKRLCAAYDAAVELTEGDNQRIAVIGFGFGGLCALDLAYSGVNLKGVVSFHGLLQKPKDLPMSPISAKVLVLHGYDDPIVIAESVQTFAQDMTQAKVDWQIHMYGHTQHAFTDREACDLEKGMIYDPKAEKRAMQAMVYFLDEIFSEGISSYVVPQ